MFARFGVDFGGFWGGWRGIWEVLGTFLEGFGELGSCFRLVSLLGLAATKSALGPPR